MTVGDYKLDISIQYNGQGSFYALSTSPFYIKCHVTTTDARWTTITGEGKNYAIAGIPNGFLVTVFDQGNNQQQTGGDRIAVTIVSQSGLITITEIEIFDNQDGTYRVKYEVNDASEPYTVTVTVNGDTANKKTTQLVVDPNTSNAVASKLTGTSTPLTIAADHTFNFQIFDSFNNPIWVPSYILAVLSG